MDDTRDTHTYHFFALMSRMKHINRWGLMRNNHTENLSEHSLDVAIIAHALALIKNKRYSGNVNPERVALLALFHDSSEILTGDLPTPVKYYNPDMLKAYREVESNSRMKLLSFLPEYLGEDYRSIFFQSDDNEELEKIVKAADKISALIKCIEEKRSGNHEFSTALESTREAIAKMKLPEAEFFLKHFLPSFELTLDQLN